jgi:hypothetical protein
MQFYINTLDFSVLKSDCERPEIEILNSLIARPKNIIIEMHPIFKNIDSNEFLDSMEIKFMILLRRTLLILNQLIQRILQEILHLRR